MSRINCPKINPEIIFKDLEDERILFDPKTDSVQTVNELGKFICQHCNGKLSVDQIIDKILKNYQGVTRETVSRDLGFFLDEMKKRKWIRPNE